MYLNLFILELPLQVLQESLRLLSACIVFILVIPELCIPLAVYALLCVYAGTVGWTDTLLLPVKSIFFKELVIFSFLYSRLHGLFGHDLLLTFKRFFLNQLKDFFLNYYINKCTP